MQCTSATFCVAVGSYFLSSSDSSAEQTLVERWNGTTWKIVASPNHAGADRQRSHRRVVYERDQLLRGRSLRHRRRRRARSSNIGTERSGRSSRARIPADVAQSELTGVTCRSATQLLRRRIGPRNVGRALERLEVVDDDEPEPDSARPARASRACRARPRRVAYAVGDFFQANVGAAAGRGHGTARGWSIVEHAGARGHDSQQLQRCFLRDDRELLRGRRVSAGPEPAPADRPVLVDRADSRSRVHSSGPIVWYPCICSATAGSR